jgi:hypothetical protein
VTERQVIEGRNMMLMMLPIYTAKWEREAARKDGRQVEAEQAGLARVLWLASKGRQLLERSQPQFFRLKRLWTSPRHAEA